MPAVNDGGHGAHLQPCGLAEMNIHGAHTPPVGPNKNSMVACDYVQCCLFLCVCV